MAEWHVVTLNDYGTWAIEHPDFEAPNECTLVHSLTVGGPPADLDPGRYVVLFGLRGWQWAPEAKPDA